MNQRNVLRGRPETRRPPPPRFAPAPPPLPPASLSGIRHILVIRLRAMGDVVLATPVPRALRTRFPDARIAMMADDLWTPLLEGVAGIDEVIPHPKRGRSPGVSGFREGLSFVAEVRARRFDLVVDLFGNPRSALLTACSGARYRLGYDVRGRRHAYNLRQPRHVLANGTPRLRYATEVNLDMARRLGADLADSRAELVVSDAEKRGARERLAGLGIGPDEHTVAILPSGSWPAKTWPEDRFARMADLIARRPRTRVVLLWGPGEEGIARRVAARMTESAEVAPPLGLRELMAFLQTVTLFVGNDSGPKHLAAAVGTPVVALYGPTRAATWHPPGTAHVAVSVPVPCGPCDRTLCPDLRCLLAITPEHVAREVIVRLP